MAITSESRAEKAARKESESTAVDYLSMTDNQLAKAGLTRQRADALAAEATNQTFVNEWLRENRDGIAEEPI